MAQTANLGLPLIDESMTANVPRDMNALAEAVDSALGNVKVPDASLTEKGIVQLSNSTNSTAENMAATPKAVKEAYGKGAAAETNAKNYVDSKPWQKALLTRDDSKNIDLPPGFDLNTLVKNGFYNGFNLKNAPALEGEDRWIYIEVQCHSNGDDYVLQRASKLNSGVNALYQRTKENGVWNPWSPDLFTSVANGKQAIATAISGKGVPASGSDEFSILAQKIGQISTGSRSFFDFANPEYSYDRSTSATPRYKDLFLIAAGTGFVDCYSIHNNISNGAISATTYFRNHMYSYQVNAFISLIDSAGLVLHLANVEGQETNPATAEILGFSIDRAAKQVEVTTWTATNATITKTLTLPNGFNSTGVIRVCAGHRLRMYGGSSTSVFSGTSNVRSVFKLEVN